MITQCFTCHKMITTNSRKTLAKTIDNLTKYFCCDRCYDYAKVNQK